MKKVFKSTFREIKSTFGRFLGILIIIAIGCSFYTGLKSVKPDMMLAAEKYYEKSNFMDIHMISSVGFNDEDVKSVGEAEGVKTLETSCVMDVMGSFGRESRVVKLCSIPEKVNTLELKSGRMPQKSGECVLLGRKNDKGIKLGDSISFTAAPGKDVSESLRTQTYKVVGIVTSPLYITKELGPSKIGSGSIGEVVYIPKEDFTLPLYTDLYLLMDGENRYQIFSEEYNNYIKGYETTFEKIQEKRTAIRHSELKEEASKELGLKETEYNDSVKKLEDKKAEYRREIENAEHKLKEAEKKMADSEKELTLKEKEYNNAIFEIANRKAQYEAEISKAQSGLTVAGDKLVSSGKQIEEQEKGLAEQKEQLESAKESGTLPKPKIASMEAGIREGEIKLAAAKQQLEKGWAEYDKNKATFETKRVKGKDEINKAEQRLNESKAKMDEAKQKLKSGQSDLIKSKTEISDKKIKAEAEFADAEKELSDAKIKLEDAKQQINTIEKPQWYVLDREANPGYADFKAGTERVGGLSAILPAVFFLIAALVCLTSMTRMVDEQRTQIGTLKALGYGKFKIVFKYIFYAAFASVMGGFLGLLVGVRLIPAVIFRAYKSLYTLPLDVFPIHLQYGVFAAALGIIVTVLAAYLTCSSALSAVPSTLMRPQAPKEGKRLLIERVSFLWKRLKFSQKVSVRNIFRYKKRLLMTVFGVACCCALVLSGFGLRDSIKVPARVQFAEIFTYNSYIKYKETATESEKQNILSTVQKNGLVKDAVEGYYKNIEIQNGDIKQDITLIVSQKPEELDKFIHLRVPGNQTKITLTDDDAVISEKAADMLGITIGSSVKATRTEGDMVGITVGSICENYLQHYMFMTPGYYKKVFGEDVPTNQMMINLNNISSEKQSEFGKIVTELSGVAAIGFMSDAQNNLNDTVSSLDLIVWVILISAGLLAFVVLYTLTTININERMREIATIKVLGFVDREVNSYIFRESYILTFLGILLGLAAGIILHQYILKSATIEQMMYYQKMMPLSFLYSAFLTFAFSFTVSRLLQKKMKNVNMVEALKSVE